MESAATIVVLKMLAVMALVLLNGFFVAAEFAIVKIRDTQLAGLIQKGHRRARVARRLISNLDASLSATQLGITLASLGLGWVGEPVFASLLEPVMEWLKVESAEMRHTIAFVVGFSIITFLHIVAGELAPKSLAIQKPLPTTLWVALPLLWFYKLSYPFIWALNGTSLWLLRQLGIEPVSEAELVHSEEELRLLFSTSHKHSAASTVGRDLVLNAMDLRRRVAREVMRPRQEITVLDTTASLAECLDVAERTRYSRFPLCEQGDIDKTLGVVHLKDLFALRHRARLGTDLVSVARKIIFIPESCRLEKLLQLFLERKLHLALVVDEYGSTVGLVTLENILEELVGQIQDEFDQEKPLVVRTGETSWELLGTLPLHELAELVGEPIEAGDLATTSGWVVQRLGGFPKPGDVVSLGAFQLRVEECDGLVVTRLSLRRAPEAPVE
ncbi:MAG TPA: hemolysin family protein [Methylomirabilota bacterium]|nr:hemolysin family protein [Methylomirabilota bacterium]